MSETYRDGIAKILDSSTQSVYLLGIVKGDCWEAKNRGEMSPEAYKIICEEIDKRINKLQRMESK